MTGIWETADVITKARMNEKTIFIGTGAEIAALTTTYPGQQVFCTVSGSNYYANKTYTRNAANTAFFNLNESYYGTGADGNVTISTNTTLTADKNYNNLTIDSGITLNTAGFTVYVFGTLTNNGIITDSTNNIGINGSSGGTGGTGAYSAGGGGSNGGDSEYAKGGVGGSGGSGGGAGSVGSKGFIGSGGAGGGGGSGGLGGNHAGGAGASTIGMGGGTVIVYANTLVNNGSIHANGTNGVAGSNGSSGASNANSGGGGGGSGGGSGGKCTVFYSTLTTLGIITANGGSGGAGGAGGSTGSAGGAGADGGSGLHGSVSVIRYII